MNNLVQNPVAVGGASQSIAMALTVLLCWALHLWGIDPPADVTVAFSTLIGALIHTGVNANINRNLVAQADGATTVTVASTSAKETTGDAGAPIPTK